MLTSGLRDRAFDAIRAIAGDVVDDLSLPALELLSGRSVVSPCYHIVTDRTPAHIKHLYVHRDIRTFCAELDWLLKRYSPVSLVDLQNGRFSGRSMFLSFDDGLREVYDIIAPICVSKGVPATFFVNSGFLDNRELFFRHKASVLVEACQSRDIESVIAVLGGLERVRKVIGNGPIDLKTFFLSFRFADRAMLDECAESLGVDINDYLQKERPYLTTEQLRDLVRQGFSVGAHSVDHPQYSDVTLAEQVRQTRQCLLELAEYMPVGLRSFAFPFVSDGVSAEFFEQVFREHIAELIFCIGEVPPQMRAGVIRRFPVDGGEYSLLDESLKGHLRSTVRLRLGVD